MKSSQLNFFIHPDDLAAIEIFLAEKGAVVIPQPTRDISTPFSPSLMGNGNAGYLNIAFLINASLVPDCLFFKKVDKQDYSVVDIDRSLVIEFSFGGAVLNGKLNRSRFYYKTGIEDETYDPHQIASSVKWAKELVKDFKKFFITSENEKGHLFSKRILRWLQDNDAVVHASGLYLISNGKKH